MTSVSNAYRMLSRLYRGVLTRMRSKQQAQPQSFATNEQLEPKLMMSADLALNYGMDYAINEDSYLEFSSTAVGLTVSDTSDDQYDVNLTTDDGDFFVPLSGGGYIISDDIDLSGSSISEINDALEDVIFVPTANFNGTAEIDFSLVDDSSNEDSGTISVTVNAINDAPSLTVPASATMNEDNSFVFTGASAISISDVEGGEFVVDITVPLNVGTLSYDATGVMDLSTVDTTQDYQFYGDLSDINSLLDSMSFVPAADYNGSFDITFAVHDIGPDYPNNVRFDGDHISVTVDAVADAPNLVAPASISLNEDSSFAFTGSNAIVIEDVDAPSDVFFVEIMVSDDAGTLTYDSVTGVSASGWSQNGSNIYQFQGAMSDVNTLLASLEFVAEADYYGSVSMSISAHEWFGDYLNDSASVGITVNAVADAPTLVAPASISLNEDSSFAFTGSNAIVIEDVDAPSDVFFVEIMVSEDAGTLTYDSVTGVSASGWSQNGSNIYQFQGAMSDVNTLLASLEFVAEADYYGSVSMSISAHEWFGDYLNDSASVGITVNAVADAPTLVAPASVSLDEDSSFAFTGDDAIVIEDVDAPSDVFFVEIMVSDAAGTLTYDSVTGVSASGWSQNGSNIYQFQGAMSDVNTLLASLEFVAETGYTGTVSMSVNAVEWFGSYLSDSDSISITVNAI